MLSLSINVSIIVIVIIKSHALVSHICFLHDSLWVTITVSVMTVLIIKWRHFHVSRFKGSLGDLQASSLMWSIFRKKLTTEIKKVLRETQIVLAVVKLSQKCFRPATEPLPGGAGQQNLINWRRSTTFTYRPSLVEIVAHNFELSW